MRFWKGLRHNPADVNCVRWSVPIPWRDTRRERCVVCELDGGYVARRHAEMDASR